MLPYRPPNPATVAQIRATDRYAIDTIGVPGIVLMENAARGIAEWLIADRAGVEDERFVLLAGPGNNGGDALAVARLLTVAGAATTVILAADAERYRGDAATNLAIVRRLRIPCRASNDPEAGIGETIESATVIVDGLLGTGATGQPRDRVADLIEQANAAVARRIAIDVPTGLDADTGQVADPCFAAAATLTLLAPKVGFDGAEAGRVLGDVVVLDIGLPPDVVVAAEKNAARG